jgi:hypothetical protein
MTDFLVKRDDLRECRTAHSDELGELSPGQALLRVDRFGLTANNITYAVFGEMMSYWKFFPAQEGWGRVPVWGFAEIERSEAEGVEPGTRVYGYLPPSSHLVVIPARVDEHGFIDGSPHRAELPAVYQSYVATDGDPFYREDTEELQMLLRPLFITSFLIADQLIEDGLASRGPIVISSASSKTAIAAAFLLAQREGVEVIGLTSPRSVAFVDGLGIYERTVAYDTIDSLHRGPATFVDIAGDSQIRRAVHSFYGDELAYSMVVGATHWENPPQGEDKLPGPPPTFFFAPDRVATRSRDWGPAGLQTRAADAWQPFCDWIGSRLRVVPGDGFEAVQHAYLDVLEGRVGPELAHVLSIP